MPVHIAVGVDGSLESLAAADWAAHEATLRAESLLLVHAWQWQAHPAAVMPSSETQRDWGERLLQEARERISGRHPELVLTTDLVSGTPVAALLTAAAKARLLVLGSRGLGGVTGFLLGSVGLETVAAAEHPVVLVRPGEQEAGEPTRAGGGRREVVLGLNVQRPRDEVTRFGFDAAERREALLRVAYSWDVPPMHRYSAGLPGPTVDPQLEADRRGALSDALKPWREKYPDVEVAEEAVTGRAGNHLVSAAAEADLLVIGHRRRNSGHGAHLGPVAHAVIHHARCPVAVIPHG